MKNILFLLPLLLIFRMELKAQDSLQSLELSITLGYRDFAVERFQTGPDIDFLNYAKREKMELLSAIGIGAEYRSNGKFHVALKGYIHSNLQPEEFEFFSDYFFTPNLGLGLGAFLKTFYISNYGVFHTDTYPGYIDRDQNGRQFHVQDLGFSLSPVFRLDLFSRLEFLLHCDLGLASFLKEEDTFFMKKIYSNEIQFINYQSEIAFHPYVNPRFDLRMTLLDGKMGRLGILFKANYFYSKRSMDYHRSVQNWTAENRLDQKVETPRHAFSRLDINFGVFFMFKN
ncbi:MAG TPA: hypothetical protein PLK12_13040 [Prolixibacteraceae bacterium]|nr:hypothetical protein [Prolixibacteraceae bacterium]